MLTDQLGRRKLKSKKYVLDAAASASDVIWVSPRKWWTSGKGEENMQNAMLKLVDVFLAAQKEVIIVTPRDFRFKDKDPSKLLHHVVTPGHNVFSTSNLSPVVSMVGPSFCETMLSTAIVRCLTEGRLEVGQSLNSRDHSLNSSLNPRSQSSIYIGSSPQVLPDVVLKQTKRNLKRTSKSPKSRQERKVTFDDDDGTELGDHASNNDAKPDYAAEYAKQNAKEKKSIKKEIIPSTDDCGDDVTAIEIEESAEFVAFLEDYESTECPSSDSSDNKCYLQSLDELFMYSNRYFVNPTPTLVTDHSPVLVLSAEEQQSFHIATELDEPFCSHFWASEKPGPLHVLEIFGGYGGVTRLAIKRRLATGKNHDLSVGIDLLKPGEKQKLLRYIDLHAPEVVILGPPCTSFGPWARFNKIHAFEAWSRSHSTGLPLANLCAEVAQKQHAAGRFFIIENPWSSTIWELPSFQRILAFSHTAYCEQCCFGLVDMDGSPTLKPTAFISNSESLISNLNAVCGGRHSFHAPLAGSLHGVSKCRFAQRWPSKLCHAIVDNVAKICFKRHEASRYTSTTRAKQNFLSSQISEQLFPTDEVIKSCPGCKAHAYRRDARHNRVRGVCNFPDDTSEVLKCQACVRNLPSHHPQHSKTLGECHWAEALPRLGTPSSSSRGPRVPQHVPPDAPLDAPSHVEPPPTNNIGTWHKVYDVYAIDILSQVAEREGWHDVNDDSGDKVLVSYNSRYMREPQPRYDPSLFSQRSTFARFVEHAHEHGTWWQLEDHVDFKGRERNIGFSIECLIHVFHPAGPSPTENKTGSGRRGDEIVEAPRRIRISSLPEAARPAEPIDVEPLREAEYGEEEAEIPAIALGERQIAVPRNAEEELAEQTIEKTEPVDWSSIDLGTALRELKSTNPSLVTRALRKLHLRWWHAPTTRMRSILSNAQVSDTVLKLVPDVVDSCRVCRAWKKPTSKSMSHLTQAEGFNERVQIDLLFIGQWIILHACDEATRFTVAEIVKSKEPQEVLTALKKCWIRYFGAPKVFVSDSEGALGSEEASIWAERLNTSFKLLPRNSHATIVERHHETLRQLIHRIMTQCKLEGINIGIEDIVSEAVVAKNSMLVINGVTPYTAVLGRSPNLLGEYEKPPVSSLADNVGGELSKHVSRVREIAISSMVEHSSKERIKRAQESQTRISTEQLELVPNDLVDIYRTPRTKDNIGWRGPCKVVSAIDGQINVSWNGRIISCRPQDVRRALLYPSFLQDRNEDVAFEIVRNYVRNLKDTAETFGVVSTPEGWKLSSAIQKQPTVFRALLKVAYELFYLPRCIGAKIGRGTAGTTGLIDTSMSVLVWWPVSSPQLYKSMSCPGTATVNLKELFGEGWIDTCWIRMFSCEESQVAVIRRVVPDLPHLVANPPGPLAAVPMDDEEIDQSMPSVRDSMSTASTRIVTPMNTASTGHHFPPRPPPPQPPQHGVRQQRTPIQSDRSRSSLAPSDYAPQPPPQPPQVPQQQRYKQPKTPIPSGRSRSSYAPSEFDQTTPLQPDASQIPVPTGSSSKSVSSLKEPRKPSSPRGDKRNYETESPQRHKQTRTTPSSQSSSRASASTDIPEPQVPLLPVHEDESDESDAEAIFVPEDVLYTDFSLKPPPLYHSFEYAPGIAEIAESQQHYLDNSVITTEHVPMRSGKKHEETVEIEVGPRMARMFYGIKDLAEDEVLVFKSSAKSEKPTVQIEKNYDALTAEEVKQHYKLVEIAVRKELASFVEHKTFKRALRTACKNICSSRWVLRWKEIDGRKEIKARLTIRGYEDIADVSSYASTASRWAQRLIVSLAAQNTWKLWVTDISTAFLRGMTFTELAQLTGSEVRDVAFTPPKGWERYFSELPDLGNFNFATEVFRLLKAVYGLRDAPRAWRIRLDRELRKLGGVPLCTDKALYCFYTDGKLDALLSTHVDDIKGAGTETRTAAILAGLEAAFGKLKTQFDSFLHCGLQHSPLPEGGYKVDQHHYAQQLIAIDTTGLNMQEESTPLNQDYTSRYMSLLGGLSWLVQTRTDICIYVCALQRAASKATNGHLLKLNKVTKWVRRKKCQLTFKPTKGEIVLACVSDSAFKTEPFSSVAMRGTIIGIWCKATNVFHPIEYYSRKQRRVCRSTFAAELNGAADAVEVSRLINYTLTHMHNPKITPSALMSLEESGQLPVPLILFTDCRSVYDTLTASDLRTPTEASLVLIVAMLRELLEKHAIQAISWISTNDMVADGLTKGLISRKGLLKLCNEGTWQLLEESAIHSYGPRNNTEQPELFANAVLFLRNHWNN